jgi:protein-S-isoprenylcysteine O-methyltransferase Ste14
MKYPVDVLFLDKNGCVVHLIQNLRPKKMTKIVPYARSVLELAPGSISQYKIKIGDRLRVIPDEEYHPDIAILKNLFHWPINVFIALLWSKFVLLAISDWFIHREPLSFGVIIHNTILLGLFLTRRKSTDTSYRILDWIIPVLVMTCVMLLRGSQSMNSTLFFLSGLIQIIGILGIIGSLLSLGRSFGVIPANRRIKLTGAYKIVRHPVYSSEIIFYLGFILGNFSPRNSLLIPIIIAGQFWRSIAEERLLSKDMDYRTYLRRVQYRFIPGLF